MFLIKALSKQGLEGNFCQLIKPSRYEKPTYEKPTDNRRLNGDSQYSSPRSGTRPGARAHLLCSHCAEGSSQGSEAQEEMKCIAIGKT